MHGPVSPGKWYAFSVTSRNTIATLIILLMVVFGLAHRVISDVKHDFDRLKAAIFTTSVTVLPRTEPMRNPHASPLPEILTSSSNTQAVNATEEPIRLLFVGDIMPSRYVAVKMARNTRAYPFRDTSFLTRKADLAFANLESPVTSGRAIANSEMIFRTDPEVIPELARAGFDVVSLANNHTPNWGESGLRDTVRILASSSIAYAGVGTRSDAYVPIYMYARGLRIAIIAQNDSDVVPADYCAGGSRIGTACFDIAALASSTRAARSHADFVVFTMHAGVEYATTSSARQRAFARDAIDAGADVVIGHHPHVIQNEEVYKGKPIFYSLGNFIFDQDLSPATQRGLVVILQVSPRTKTITAIERYRVRIEDYARPVITSSSTTPFPGK